MRRRLFVPFLAVPLLLVAAAAPVSAQEGHEDTVIADPVITSATVARSGDVTLTGTVTCEEAGFAFLELHLRQNVGRLHTIQGGGFTEVECTEAGEVVPFTTTVRPFEGRFAPGRARLFMFAQGECDEFSCEFEDFGERTVRLTRK